MDSVLECGGVKVVLIVVVVAGGGGGGGTVVQVECGSVPYWCIAGSPF